MSYRTSKIAKIIGVHPNTVRFYEEIKFISPVPRQANGYRVFNSLHLEQLKLVRIALSAQLLSNNLRKEVIEIIKKTTRNEVEQAISLAHVHKAHVQKEKYRAEEAIALVESIIAGKEKLECMPKRSIECFFHFRLPSRVQFYSLYLLAYVNCVLT